MAPSRDRTFEVVIAGGGVAGLEATLALHAIAPERVHVTLLEPKAEFRYRPLAVREPFSAHPVARYPVAEIVRQADVDVRQSRFKWLDPVDRIVHTDHGHSLRYDALLLALGARSHPRFRDVTTVDPPRLGEQLAGFVAALDAGELHSAAFVVPSLPIWALPAYELALMTATRAADRHHDVSVLLITPEDAPLAVLGAKASAAVAELLAQAGVTIVTSANCQIRDPHTIDIYPLRSSISVDAVVALPELYAPATPGVPTSAERGFITVDHRGAAHGLQAVFAAGDIVDSPVKHGSLSAEQAVIAAESIAELAGARVEPHAVRPNLNVLLLGGPKPLFMSSQMLGEHGLDVEISEQPLWYPVGKLEAQYLGPCLAAMDAAAAP